MEVLDYLMAIRAKRRLIVFCYHAVIIVGSIGLMKLGAAIGNNLMPKIAVAIVIGDALTFRLLPLSRHLCEWLMPEAVCYSCGTVIELMGIFRCGCGYQSYKERHVFSPCPMCGKVFLFIECPVDGTTIPI